MQHRCVGKGSPLVLVHGLAGSGRWWEPVLPALSASHEVHLLDLPRRLFDPDALVDRLAVWAEPLGPAAFVGHSLGGLLSVRLAARHPETVERLALVAPAGIPGRSPLAMAVPLAQAVLRSHPRVLPHLALGTLRGGPLSTFVAGARLLGADVRPDLAHVRAPTLLLWGDRDPLVPVEHAQGFLDALPHARLELVQGAAHVPMHERPAAFSDALLAFLREAR